MLSLIIVYNIVNIDKNKTIILIKTIRKRFRQIYLKQARIKQLILACQPRRVLHLIQDKTNYNFSVEDQW